MRTSRLLIAVLLLVASTAHAEEVDLHNIQLPAGARTGWVGSDITHNGHAMAIKTFSSREPLEAVLNFYRDKWAVQGDIPGFVENEMGDWSLISRISTTHNIVVQLKPNNGNETTGFISSMSLAKGKPYNKQAIELPPNTKRLSHTKTKDYGKTGYTTILISRASNGAIAGFYKDKLKRRGWKLVSDELVDNSSVLKFNKKESTYDVSVTSADDGSVVILLNRTSLNG